MAIEKIRPESLEEAVELLEAALERARSGESMGVFIVEYVPGGETRSSSAWESAVSKLPAAPSPEPKKCSYEKVAYLRRPDRVDPDPGGLAPSGLRGVFRSITNNRAELG